MCSRKFHDASWPSQVDRIGFSTVEQQINQTQDKDVKKAIFGPPEGNDSEPPQDSPDETAAMKRAPQLFKLHEPSTHSKSLQIARKKGDVVPSVCMCTGHLNQFKCDDGTVRFCASNEACLGQGIKGK